MLRRYLSRRSGVPGHGRWLLDEVSRHIFGGLFLPGLVGARRLPAAGRQNSNPLALEPLEPRQLLASDGLVISEFLADNDTSRADEDGDFSDWIEVHNSSSTAVDLTGWYLTDESADLSKWRLPAVSLDGGDHLLVFASGKDHATSGAELHTNFKLDKQGEYLALVEPDGHTVAHAFSPAYPEQYGDVSYGLSASGRVTGFFLTPTPGALNVRDPVADPSQRVVFNEIMYHPSSENPLEEYIELYNAGGQPVDLSGAYFGSGIQYAFPNVVIQPGDYLVVAADTATFRAMRPSVTNVVGGWTGQLSNRGEQIELLAADGTRIDRVTYADEGDWAPRRGPVDQGSRGWIWQAGHDGLGKSLELVSAAMSNRQGQNWGASVPNGGTPGAVNSVVASDIAPMILDVKHTPEIPNSTDLVTVSARIVDESDRGVTATLYWRVDGAATFNAVVMLDRGQLGDQEAGDGIYAANISAQADGTVVEFYVDSGDLAGNRRTWPAPTQPSGQQEANALYIVLDSFASNAAWEPGSPVVYHQIMTAAERREFRGINRQSDAQMNATFIAVTGTDIDVRYNAGIRIRGSNSRTNNPPNNRINLPRDNPWQGLNQLNINQLGVQDQIAGSVLHRLAGLPAAEAKGVVMLNDGVNLYGNQRYAHVEPLGTGFVENQFPDDNGGNLYKGRRSNESPPGGRGAGLQYFGTDPAPYASYTKLTNATEADWSDVIDLTYRLNRTSNEEYIESISQVVDIDQWLRFLAMTALLDNNEGGLALGDPQGDDYVMYRGVDDPRFRLILHDLDTLFGQWDRGILRARGNPALQRFLDHPEIRRRYYVQLVDLIDNTLLTDEANTALDEALRNVVPQGQIDNIKNFITRRSEYVLSLIPREFTIDSGLPMVGGVARSTQPVLALSGTADTVTTHSVLVNGQPVETFTGEGVWSFSGQPGGAATETLVATGATWRYLDDGSNQGTQWRALGFNDSSWKSGPAVLGYGDNNEATVVNYIDTTPGNPGNVTKNATTYFRSTFQVDDPTSVAGLTIRMRYDDAAAVYINGVEAIRTSNLAANPAFDTFATAGDTPDENAYFDFVVPASVLPSLRVGANSIAAEVHQGDSQSSDIKFDLALTATVAGEVTSGIALNPGINRVRVEAFDGPDGTGNVVDSGYLDVWYEGAAVATPVGLPAPEVDHLQLAVRDSYLAGVPLLVRVEARGQDDRVERELWDAEVTLSTDRPGVVLSSDKVRLYNGLGSQLVSITGSGDFTLTATLGKHVVSRTIVSMSATPTTVSGTLSGASSSWSGVVVVADDLTVPVGHTLTIQPGTLVLLHGDPVGATDSTKINVRGTLLSLGTADRPITLTAIESNAPWGQIDVVGGRATFHYTNIHQAGNATGQGHTNSGAAIRVSNNGVVDFSDGSITDLRGKVMQSTAGDVVFTDSLFARAVMGPEIANTSLQFHDNWIVEMAGVYHRNGTVDDNDGIYLHDQSPGQTIVLSGGVVANTQDDGIDTLNSDVTITDYIVRDIVDKAVSVFDGEVRIQRGLLVDSNIGVNTKGAGSSRPHTIIDQTTIAGVNFGIVAEDKDAPDPNVVITYDVTNSIIDVNSGGDPVSTDYNPIDIHIVYSNVGEVWPGQGNISVAPLLADASAGDYRLLPGSPSIDAADPSSNPDPDGTRADQGFFANGLAGSFAAQTIGAGTIRDNLILTSAGGPYMVTGNVVIHRDARLTILPGTTVFFAPDVQLQVAGQLTVLGTEDQPVRLTRVPGGSNSWRGIQLANSMRDNRIHHAIIEYAVTDNGMIGLDNSQLELDHVTLDHTDRRRIRSIDSSLVVRNSTFTQIFAPDEAPTSNNLSEHIWGRGIPQGGQFVIEDNVFGHITGHNDGIDFDAPQGSGPVARILNNHFLGGGDDALDMTGNVYIEGNVFQNFHKDRFNTDPGQSNVISSSSGQYTVVRNVFENVDHVSLVKENAFMTFTNNTVVGAHFAALYFDLAGQTSGPGRGADVDGSVFADTPVVFDQVLPTTLLTVDNSIVSADYVALGQGNLSLDAGRPDAKHDYQLPPSSPAIGTGPNGLDMGANVPAGASISGEPAAVTSATSVNLTVGGPGITHYRYRFNDGQLSEETSIDIPIGFTNLPDGTYTVSVIGRNSAGVWQSESDATQSRTWTVQRSLRIGPRVVINEVLAENATVLNNAGTRPDLIELYNAGDDPIDLNGMSLTDDPDHPDKFVFTGSRIIGPGQFLTLLADTAISKPGIHLGFALQRGGEGVYLHDTQANGRGLLDSVQFGVQIPDRSIGRLGNDGHWGLTVPTFGAANIGQATGDWTVLKINEWLADAGTLLVDDFLELYNSDSLPVDMGGLFLTDELGGAPAMHQIAALSFVPARGYVSFLADGNSQAGPEHLNFRLSPDQEILALLDADLEVLDRVTYFPQTTDVSQGRSPNGGETYQFFVLPTPGAANPQTEETRRENLLAFGDTWKYNDSGNDLGTAWREPGFADAAWASGPGPIGVENEPLPIPLRTEMTLGATTFYFRKQFTLETDPRDMSIELATEIDDGAVVYINGSEVLRVGMPAGEITYNTISNRFVNEAGLEGPFTIPSSALVRGQNTVAVEVHQGTQGTTDVVFGLEMTATITSDSPEAGNAEAVLAGLRVSEIMYHPYDALRLEFIELLNTTDRTIDLDGVRIRDGIEFTFPQLTLDSGQYVVVVQDVAAFVARYGTGVRMAGQYGGTLDDFQLNNAGETLRLEDSLGRTISQFSYNDSGNWPGRADGSGASLEVLDTRGDYDDGRNWRSSWDFGGSPGAAASARIVDVVVNEVLSHTDPPLVDAIELYNTSARAVDVSGWFISDSNENLKKFRIPSGTVIAAGGYVAFDESNFNRSGGTSPGDFALSSSRGDDVWLVQADTSGKLLRLADHVEFGATELGVSLGRWPNGDGKLFPMESRTFGRINSGPRPGDVILSEVHYNPVDSDGVGPMLPADVEFIELYNRTASTVDLSGWRLAGGIDKTFVAGTTIGPRQTLLVVPFDPADSQSASLFRLAYGLSPTVRLIGPYSGTLDNGGETVRVERPDEPPMEDPSLIPYLLVDRISYTDLAPWPTSADGGGDSLSRNSATAAGDLASSWTASRPTPGVANLFVRQAGDANEDGKFDQFDVIVTLQGGKYRLGSPAAWSDGDWNGDGRFDQLDIIAALQTGNYLQGPYASQRRANDEDLGRGTISGKPELPVDAVRSGADAADLAYVAAIDLLMEENERD